MPNPAITIVISMALGGVVQARCETWAHALEPMGVAQCNDDEIGRDIDNCLRKLWELRRVEQELFAAVPEDPCSGASLRYNMYKKACHNALQEKPRLPDVLLASKTVILILHYRLEMSYQV